MKSFEALKRAAGEQQDSRIAEIARRMVLSRSRVYKWTEPAEDPEDSGSRNPLDIIEQFMESCLLLGASRADALAPLEYLNHRFGQVCFSVPENIKSLSPDDLNLEMIRCMKEAGDVVATYQVAIQDKSISKRDMKNIEREVWEAVTQFLVLLYCVKETAK